MVRSDGRRFQGGGINSYAQRHSRCPSPSQAKPMMQPPINALSTDAVHLRPQGVPTWKRPRRVERMLEPFCSPTVPKSCCCHMRDGGPAAPHVCARAQTQHVHPQGGAVRAATETPAEHKTLRRAGILFFHPHAAGSSLLICLLIACTVTWSELGRNSSLAYFVWHRDTRSPLRAHQD